MLTICTNQLLPSSVDELMFTHIMRKRCVIGSFQLLILINKHLLDVRLFTIAGLPDGMI